MIGDEHYTKKRWHSCSSLCAACKCPRYYFYTAGCRLGSSEQIPAMEYGTAMHLALPYCHKGDIGGAMAAFVSHWRPLGYTEDPKRNELRALATLKEFTRSHFGSNSIYEILPPPPGTTPSEKRSDDEIAFAIDVGLDLPLVGIIDALGRHRDLGTLFAIEYKTTSELSTRFMNSFTMSPQALIYWLAISMQVDEEVGGTIIEGLLTAKATTRVQSLPLHFRVHQAEEIIAWIKVIDGRIKTWEAQREWPKDFSGCNSYPLFHMPGYPCEYQMLCSVEDWTPLKGFYKVNEERPFPLQGVQSEPNKEAKSSG